MNPTKNSDTSKVVAEKNLPVIYIEITSDKPLEKDRIVKQFTAEYQLEPIAFLGVQQTGAYEERKREIRAFERTLKSAILIAKQRVLERGNNASVGLLFNTFEVFELDASLPVLEVLLNSISGDRDMHPVFFADFPDADLPKLDFLAQVYQRRSDRRKTQDNDGGDNERQASKKKKAKVSDHHFTKKRNRRNSRLGKYQRRFLDENNLAAMRLVNDLHRRKHPRRQKLTLMEMAIQLDKGGIATSTGKTHTPKSVSRLLNNLEEIKVKFSGFPPWEEYTVQRAGLQGAVLLSDATPNTKKKKKGKREDQEDSAARTSGTVKSDIPWIEDEIAILNQIVKNNPYLINPVRANTDAKYPDFGDEDIIAFQLNDQFPRRLAADLTLKITNNLPDGDKDAYTFAVDWPTESDRLQIDIREETFLLPGRHYVETFFRGNPIGVPFIITLYRNRLGLEIKGGRLLD